MNHWADWQVGIMDSLEHSFSEHTDLPPTIPSDDEEIRRAICLLGNRIASDLKDKAKSELILLLGAYPSPERAKVWKHALKQMLKHDLQLEFDPFHAPVDPPPARAAAAPPAKPPIAEKKTKSQPKRRSRTKEKEQKPPQRQPLIQDYLHGVSNLASIDPKLFQDDEAEYY